MGVKTVQLTEARGQLAGARVVRDGYQVMLISTGGTVIKMPVEDVKRLGRSTQGVIVMRLREGEIVSSLAPVVDARRAADDEDGEARSRRADAAAEDVVEPVEDDERRERRRRGRRVRRPTTSVARFTFAAARVMVAAWRRANGTSVELEPVDMAAHLDKLELYLEPGVPPRRHLEDAARLLDEQGADPDQGQEAADLRPRAIETVMLIKQGRDKGLGPRRRDRGRAPLPGRGLASS